MSTKSMITVAAVIIIGAASAALAESDHEGQSGGFRELGNGAPASSGVNPVDHPSLNGTQPREPAVQTERRAPAETTEGRAPAGGDMRKGQNYGPDAGKE